jgi:serine/threonine protein kinase
MDKKPYLKILEVIDEKVNRGFYRDNLADEDELQILFNRTVFSEKFVDIDDFFYYNTKVLNYSSFTPLLDQYGEISGDLRIKVIEVVFNIIYFSDLDKKFKIQIASYLNRYNIIFSDDTYYKKIIFGDEDKYLEGSFGKVFFVGENLVKKQLKTEYWKDNDISSRFKNEYVIQKRLFKSNVRVLNVFDYNSVTNSYLMEKAELDLYDLLKDNIISFEDKVKLSRQIMSTMKSAHKMGIIHRDLHPGNIMIKDKDSYVSDFGFAKDSNFLRSRLSTVTPKPMHSFIAPEGFTDFLKLDKISDVYSIGKVIDFIFGNGNFGISHPFKLVIEKSIKSVKDERYNSVDELYDSFNVLYETHIKGENSIKIKENIDNGVYDVNVENYLLKLANDSKIATQIVANGWGNLAEVLLECDLQNQEKIMESINICFIKATGYNGWSNYDIFANIAYQMITRSESSNIVKKSYSILEECAKVRYRASDLLTSVSDDKIQLAKI